MTDRHATVFCLYAISRPHSHAAENILRTSTRRISLWLPASRPPIEPCCIDPTTPCPSPLPLQSKSICATGIRILNNEATKTQKLPYFSTVFGSAYISRKYPPEPLEHGKRLFPGFEEVKLIDKQFSPDGWRPHEEGRWVSAAGGHWKWHPELRSQYINKRCWEVTIKQLGVWGKTYSSGICIGVAAFPSGGRGLGGDTFDLEHCWRWELQNDKVREA